MKVNFDKAMFGEEQEEGIRVVIRSNEGQVLAALSEKVPMPTSVETLEMLAAQRVAIFARELSFCKVCFKGDAGREGLKCGGGALSKRLHVYRGYFQSYSIIHVRRQGNYVAHALARDARFFFPLRVWGEVVPPNIFNYVVKDLF